MQRKAHGAQNPRHILQIGEGVGTAQRRDTPEKWIYRGSQYAKDLILEEPSGTPASLPRAARRLPAYARLQFEDLDKQTRERICSALLRYCELDTLAMVMVVEAWQGMQAAA